MEGSNRFFQWFANLAYLNILWLACTLLGGVVLGIAPSTAALFAVIRQLLQREVASGSVTRHFGNITAKIFGAVIRFSTLWWQ